VLQNLLGELTALYPNSQLDLRGPSYKGKQERGKEKEKGEVEGGEGKGKGGKKKREYCPRALQNHNSALAKAQSSRPLCGHHVLNICQCHRLSAAESG